MGPHLESRLESPRTSHTCTCTGARCAAVPGGGGADCAAIAGETLVTRYADTCGRGEFQSL